MEQFIEKKCELSIVAGRGFLSLYEACNLKTGDVVRTNAVAGKPFRAYFNNLYLFSGELCILGECLAFRVSGFNIGNEVYSRSGVLDYPTEILPVDIRLDSTVFSLNELTEAGIGTFIALEKRFNRDEDAGLFIAGMPAARGKVVVIEENFGLRITETYFTFSADVPIRSSGYLMDSGLEKVKDYDFLKPDKFTWDSIINIRSIHQLFLDNLKRLVPGTECYKVLWADQLAFFELYNEIGKGYSFIIAENRTQSGKFCSGVEAGKKAFIQQEDAAETFPEELIKAIDRGFNNPPHFREALFIMAVKKKSPLAKISGEISINELFLSPLKNCWKNITALDLVYKRTEEEFDKCRIMPDKDMVLVIGSGAEEPDFLIIYPFITIENILSLID